MSMHAKENKYGLSETIGKLTPRCSQRVHSTLMQIQFFVQQNDKFTTTYFYYKELNFVIEADFCPNHHILKIHWN